MVVLDEKEVAPVEECPIVGKKEKAHTREIVGMWTFSSSDGHVGVVTVAHESAKFWRLDEDPDSGVVSFQLCHEVSKWRCGVQAADVTDDGKCVAIVGTDSILFEIVVTDEGPSVISHDLGYLELFHIKISPARTSYITTSISGRLSEILPNGKFGKREPLNNVKIVSSIAYSNDGLQVAIANNEGVVQTFSTDDLKPTNTFEIHAMKIRAMVFTPDDECLLTGSDDKCLKLFSLAAERPGVLRVYCGNKASITCLQFDMLSKGACFVSGNTVGQILLWYIEQQGPMYCFSTSHSSMVSGLSFSPSGRHLLSTSSDRQLLCHSLPVSYSTHGEGDVSLTEHNGADMDFTDVERKPLAQNNSGMDFTESERKPLAQNNSGMSFEAEQKPLAQNELEDNIDVDI